MLTLEQIRRFLVVAEYMNLTKAAEELYISASTLSKSIADMENDLGIQLFFRTHGNLSITPAGEKLMDGGGRILNDVLHLEQELISTHMGSGYQMVIGGRQLISPALTKLYRDYSHAYPKDSFTIVKVEYGRTGLSLDSSSIDLGVIVDAELKGERGQYRVYPLEECDVVAVCANFHELAGSRSVDIDELNRHKLIFCGTMGNDVCMRRPEIMEFMQTFRFSQSVDTEETMCTLARTGAGVAIMPEPVAKFICADLTHIHIRDFAQKMHVCLIWKEDNRNMALLHFLSTLNAPSF